MGQDVDNHPNVKINGTPLDVMNSFTYLGATITSNLSLNEEITMRSKTEQFSPLLLKIHPGNHMEG